MSNSSILTPESFLNFNADANLQQGNYHIDIPELKAGEQYRFHFDTTACIGCHACEVACNEQNNKYVIKGVDPGFKRSRHRSISFNHTLCHLFIHNRIRYHTSVY